MFLHSCLRLQRAKKWMPDKISWSRESHHMTSTCERPFIEEDGCKRDSNFYSILFYCIIRMSYGNIVRQFRSDFFVSHIPRSMFVPMQRHPVRTCIIVQMMIKTLEVECLQTPGWDGTTILWPVLLELMYLVVLTYFDNLLELAFYYKILYNYVSVSSLISCLIIGQGRKVYGCFLCCFRVEYIKCLM